MKDDAISPVIGVILMVAIVVILAAVIAATVFIMAGNTNLSDPCSAIETDQINITGLDVEIPTAGPSVLYIYTEHGEIYVAKTSLKGATIGWHTVNVSRACRELPLVVEVIQ